MNKIYRQVAIGAFLVMALTLSATTGGNAGTSVLTNGVVTAATLTELRTQILSQGQAYLTQAFQTCRDKVLDVVLDAFGDLAGRLKQI
jgi:hypothetical protein